MPDSIIIGAAIADIPLAPVSPEIFTAHSTPLERIAMGLGGDAANESLVLARLGHAPALVSLVGRDAPGDFVCRSLCEAGVDISAVSVREGLDTSINVVLVRPDGERGFISSRSGSMRQMGLSDIMPALDAPALSGARVACLASLFISSRLTLDDTRTLFDALKARGLTLCADTTRPKQGETLREAGEVLSRLDYFFPNLEEARALTGQKEPDAVADALLDCGVKHVALKLGGRGCLLKSREERHLVPAVPGVRCVDTTGAGDTFVAGFLYAKTRGWDIRRCARFANAAGAIAVEHTGANGGIRSAQQVEERMQGQ
jgi:sugar/nucleoside kinase (ribokinase family)